MTSRKRSRESENSISTPLTLMVKEKKEEEDEDMNEEEDNEDTLYNPEFFEVLSGPMVSLLSLSHLKANCLEELRPTFVIVYEPSLQVTRSKREREISSSFQSEGEGEKERKGETSNF